MSRSMLRLVFQSAGLVSAAVGTAEVHAAEMEVLKLTTPPLTQSFVATTELPMVSTAAFETKYCDAPIDSPPTIVSAYYPESSFVEWNDAWRREQSSLENCENLPPSQAASTSLVPSLPSPLDVQAMSTFQEQGMTFEAIRVMPLGVFSSR